MTKLSKTSRILIAVGSLAMIAAYFLPFWSIYLIAPQYPEGLSMQIWLYKLSGQVEIINGLNHYIGMKHIKAEMFPEFDFLVYVFGAFIAMGLLVAATGSRKFLVVYLSLFVAAAIAAFVDFYLWGYDYGHNLDPTAAIQVPGLSYQPPVLGHKKLLNFDAYSYPDTGCWIVAGAVAMFFIILFMEWRKNKKTKQPTGISKRSALVVSAICALIFTACTPKPEPIALGKDMCVECKMAIADPKFGGEIVTKKGKVFKFDDVHCIANFMEDRKVEMADIHQVLFVDYEAPGEFIKSPSAEFVLSSQLKSPMNGNAAAFKNKEAAEKKSAEIPGSKTTNWATLYNILIK
jgi:copper chaperone NosL